MIRVLSRTIRLETLPLAHKLRIALLPRRAVGDRADFPRCHLADWNLLLHPLPFARSLLPRRDDHCPREKTTAIRRGVVIARDVSDRRHRLS